MGLQDRLPSLATCPPHALGRTVSQVVIGIGWWGPSCESSVDLILDLYR